MKKSIATAALAVVVLFSTISCKRVSDTDLQNQATTIVTSNPHASVEVKDGVAHLNGTFEDQHSKDAMIAKLKELGGIKDVIDMSIIVAPVETVSALDPAIQKKIQDALKDFPSVKVEIVNGEIILTGNVSSLQARKIKESVDALKIGKYNNNLIIK